MDTTYILAWLNVVGPLLLAVVVAIATWQFQKWQVRIAKQKLRHDLYTRRFAIYLAFQELLFALFEKDNNEIKTAFRKAHLARLEAQFLLPDQEIRTYLDSLCNQVNDEVIRNIMYVEGVREQGPLMNDPQICQEFAEKVSLLGSSKLGLSGRHIGELSKQFAKSLSLTDFWK
jgi:hypothetical protein